LSGARVQIPPSPWFGIARIQCAGFIISINVLFKKGSNPDGIFGWRCKSLRMMLAGEWKDIKHMAVFLR